MSGTHEYTVKLSLDERQYGRLCDLRCSVNALFPESPVTLEELFDSMIETGNRQLINLRLDAFERTYSGDAAEQDAPPVNAKAADNEGGNKMDEWTTYFISVDSPHEGECDDIVEDLEEKYPLYFVLSPHAILIRTTDKADKVLSNCYPLIQGDKVLLAAIDPDTMCGTYETLDIRRMLDLPERSDDRMSGTHEFTFKLHMDDEQYQRLCNIQSRLHEKHPQVWNTPEALFEDMITVGSRHLIDQRMDTFEEMYQNDVTKQSGQSEHPDGKVTSAVAARLAAFMLREMKMSNLRPGTDFQTLAEEKMLGMTVALKILGIPSQTIQQGPGGKYTAVEIDGQTFPVSDGTAEQETANNE